ncbi:C-type lectin domain family 4 member M-like isoform X1 [Brachionus plicatilis]|uniref:C-type lectin domain family 4 member M-like isoform X1 n=1 Tax=Brachionus plicatilis TaxID=10195 RepID=A0A3M7T0J6_BRAPC|nr:C-type lectin domain family 4 member M-like isoform X1 [Brachionus plicatilis]
MIKFFAILNLIQLILCQHQQKPLPSPSFGRIFNNTIKTRNFDNSLSACTNPSSYGFIQRAGTTKYYAIADLQMNWIDGENYCQSFGAHLPVASSARFLGGKFMSSSYSPSYRISTWSGYWLGLYKSLETDSWRWIDGRSLTYSNWDISIPTDIQPGGPEEFVPFEFFVLDRYDIIEKKHRGWHDFVLNTYAILMNANLNYILAYQK